MIEKCKTCFARCSGNACLAGQRDAPRLPVILHIPHSSTVIPDDVRTGIVLSDDELAAEVLRLADSYTAELYTGVSVPGVSFLVFPVCRVVVDPERFPDDADEPMAKHGQGAVYVKTQDGRPLRAPLGEVNRRRLLEDYYHPHHRQLLALTAEFLAAHGRCLIIDCHSFPHEPFPFEEHRERGRPDICIGTDAYHTPAALERALVGFFKERGFTTDVNHPFAGALVPLAYYRKEKNVHSIMIEVNRRLYMDERTGAKKPEFAEWQKLLAEAIALLGSLPPGPG
jgi:N-formylglutamate deformylase